MFVSGLPAVVEAAEALAIRTIGEAAIFVFDDVVGLEEPSDAPAAPRVRTAPVLGPKGAVLGRGVAAAGWVM